MKKEEIKAILEELTECLTVRIVELAGVKGAQADRHAFIYYREKVYSALVLLDK
jgi:hypothetical protein